RWVWTRATSARAIRRRSIWGRCRRLPRARPSHHAGLPPLDAGSVTDRLHRRVRGSAVALSLASVPPAARGIAGDRPLAAEAGAADPPAQPPVERGGQPAGAHEPRVPPADVA